MSDTSEIEEPWGAARPIPESSEKTGKRQGPYGRPAGAQRAGHRRRLPPARRAARGAREARAGAALVHSASCFMPCDYIKKITN